MNLKAYIITMKGREISEELSRDCVASCNKFSVQSEIFDAIQQDAVDITYNQLQLKPFPGLKSFRDTKGVRGCFCSHYLLWKKCADTNQPLIVFEHDAVVIRPIPQSLMDQFDDILVLDAHSRTAANYLERLKEDHGLLVETKNAKPQNNMSIKHYNKIHIKGAHAYIIKPNGAQKLIEFTKKYGVMPADIQINPISVDLKYTQTVFCRINEKYWLEKNKKSINSYTRTEV